MSNRFLIIEDDPDVSETIKMVLTEFFDASDVVHITDGEKFRRGDWKVGGWDLVVLDLMMPGITGFEVCDQLKGHPYTQKTPILALTGYDTLQNEMRIKASGATGYMAKPFEIPAFIDEIKRLLSNGGSQ